MSETRRTFLKVTGLAGAGVIVGDASIGRAWAQGAAVPAVSFVETPVLRIGFHDYGPPSGFPVILLHGFPDDAHAFVDVAPPLADAGYRVLVPFLRGYGPTRFLEAAAPRTAQQAAIGQDVVDFADALGLPRFALSGFDWGGRAASIAAALHPDRVRAGVFIGGYSIQNNVAPRRPARSPESIHRGWYQWYLNTENGRAGLEANRHAFCRYLWETWSPTWQFPDETYDRTARSFDNPDFVDVVVHSYRHRHGNAPGEPRFDAVERQLAERPPIQAASITLYGADDVFGSAPKESPASELAAFPSLVARRVIPGAGHFMPHEKPDAVSVALLDVLAETN